MAIVIFLGISAVPVTALNREMAPGGQIESASPISRLARDEFLPVAAYANEVDEYLVVFDEVHSTTDHDIYAQRVDNGGVPSGSLIVIDEDGFMDTHPGVAYSPGKNQYLVVWENVYENYSGDHDIYAQLIKADGTPYGGEIHVAFTDAHDEKPVVTYNPGTQEYLVIFERRMGSDEFAQHNLVGKRVQENGTVISGEILIASGTLDETNPAVACDGSSYIVVWQEVYQDETNIYGQLIDSDGWLLGSKIGISIWSGTQLVPQITYNGDDDHYFVVWEDHHYTPWGIYGYRLDQTGALVGSQVNITAGITVNQTSPGVTYLPGIHSYQVVWQYEASANDHDIFTRRVAFDGSIPEQAWSISSSYSEEMHPAMASDEWMRVLSVWEDWFNISSTGVDIYGSVNTINVPTFSGGVYEGEAGDFSVPIQGVKVRLGCSHDYSYFGDLIDEFTTNPQGGYQLLAVPQCEYYNIQETDPNGYYSVASQSVGGEEISSNWIYYTYPLQGKVFSGNNFWDKPQGPVDITPPGNWANFSPPGWTNTQTVNVSVRVEDTESGLAIGTSMFSYSIDSGTTWSEWEPTQCTGSDGTTSPQTISVTVPFEDDSVPAGKNQVRFRILDMVGNEGLSANYPVNIDTVAPNNPTTLKCPTHEQGVWKSNNIVSCNWAGASDAESGVAGYSILWTENSYDVPDQYIDVVTDHITSDPLSDGDWHFLIRSVDQAGNATNQAFVYSGIQIDTTAPAVWFSGPAAGSYDHLTIRITWDGVDEHAGIESFDVQTMQSGGGWTDWQMNFEYYHSDYGGQRGQTVSFRIRARDKLDHLSDWVGPLTIHIGVNVNVLVQNESQVALYNADVYLNDTFQGYTAVNGRLSVGNVLVGDQLSARYLIEQHVASKDYHNWIYGPGDWSYRIYITSVNFDGAGYPEMFTVTNPNVDQVLTVRRDNPLIGFYALVSVEWDANDEYLTQLSETFRKASELMLDVTDGQMYFEVVDIGDQKRYYSESDYHVDASNFVHPKAHVGGIWHPDPYYLFFGRYVGVSVVIHEWGHYGFDLYDEYRNADGGSEGAGCTLDVKTTPYAVAASIMDQDGITTELCSQLTLHPHNTNTQQQAERGGPTWDTLYERYRDKQNPARWILERPSDRGAIMAGPGELPVDDWYKTRFIGAGSSACEPFMTKWIFPDGSPAVDFDVWVDGTPDLWEGRTQPTDWQIKPPIDAVIEIYGAHNGETIFGSKSCGWLCSYSAKLTASCPTSLSGNPSASSFTQIEPIVLQRDPFGLEVATRLEADGHTMDISVISSITLPTPPQAEVWQEGGNWKTVILSYNGSYYTGSVALEPTLALTGYVRVSASDAHANTVRATVAFHAEQVLVDGLTWLTSSDGQMEIFIKPGSLAETTVVSIDETSVPNWEQDGFIVVSKAYKVSASNGITNLAHPAVVSIYYSMDGLNPEDLRNLSLYRWDEQTKRWVALDTQVGTDVYFVSAEVEHLGTFAILKKNTQRIVLPIVIR